MTKTNSPQVINHLKEILEEREITGYKLAVDLNIQNSTVYNKLFLPEYFPNVKTAVKIAIYLNLTLSDLYEIKY